MIGPNSNNNRLTITFLTSNISVICLETNIVAKTKTMAAIYIDSTSSVKVNQPRRKPYQIVGADRIKAALPIKPCAILKYFREAESKNIVQKVNFKIIELQILNLKC